MKVFKSLTNRKEEFVPIDPNEVKMYSCGPTVYNYFHIGNARPFIIFDTLRRYFEFCGYDVKFVQNFTDIDDKMIKNANEQGVTVRELADRFIEEYLKMHRVFPSVKQPCIPEQPITLMLSSKPLNP